MSHAVDAPAPLAPVSQGTLAAALALGLALSLGSVLAEETVSVFGEGGAQRYGDTVRDSTGGTWRRQPGVDGSPSWRMETPAEQSRGRLDLRTDSLSRALYPRNAGGAGLSRSGLRTAPPR
ncbi:MAG: hypothetical protein AAFP17_15975 [Pseudomonadota bacterium]